MYFSGIITAWRRPIIPRDFEKALSYAKKPRGSQKTEKVFIKRQPMVCWQESIEIWVSPC